MLWSKVKQNFIWENLIILILVSILVSILLSGQSEEVYQNYAEKSLKGANSIGLSDDLFQET